ncbi:MAG TPA: uroporphyrinogen decarboxylase family protein [Chloroflexota bacterium]|jgi:uroporphyrinogen decarboxylase
MNSRERFLAVVRFEPLDVVPLPCLFQCFEPETMQRWYREGLRRDAHVITQFGFERMEVAPVALGLLPGLATADVEESEEWRVGTDREHGEETVGRADAARERFPLRTREQWAAVRGRLNPASPARYPRFFADYCRERRGRDYPLGLQLAGPFSALHDWMGLRRLGTAARTERSWVEEMVAHLGDFVVQAAQRAVANLDLDFVIIKEPWAYRAGALGSPSEFDRLFRPFFRQVVGALRAAGVPAIMVESRGRVADLIPFWLASGVNCLGFLEVGGGLDAVGLRERYGRDLVLIGNLDARVLAGQWRDIADEILAKAPVLLAAGGYFPTVDQPVPSDVPLENYEYYLALLRHLGGDEAAEWESHERRHVLTVVRP